MFQQFSHWARQAVALAQDEARELEHGSVGAEHLLLGLTRTPGGSAPEAMKSLDVDLDDARRAVDTIAGGRDQRHGDLVPFAPSLKRALDEAVRVSAERDGGGLGTGDLLEAILETADVAQVLGLLGLEVGQVAVALQQARDESRTDDDGPEALAEHHIEPHCPRCRSLVSQRGRTEIQHVPADEGGTTKVLFVYCEGCGITLGATAIT